jgi:predicted RNase H-like HicB family nuclease
MTTYEVVAERSGRWWAARVPALPGVHTQARRLDQVATMAREAIALMLDTSVESITVNVTPALSEPTRDAITRTVAARQAREAAAEAERAALRAAARALADEGLTLRDAGRILGLSYQRVDQLLAS